MKYPWIRKLFGKRTEKMEGEMRRNGTALFKKRNYLEDFLEQKQRKIGRRRPKVSKNLTIFVEKKHFSQKSHGDVWQFQ